MRMLLGNAVLFSQSSDRQSLSLTGDGCAQFNVKSSKETTNETAICVCKRFILLYFFYIFCPFVCLAFICHHNSFLIYGSLQQPTLANWSRVTHVSVGSALIISAAFAVAGYTTFTGYTQGRRIGLHCPKFVFVI